MSDATITCIGCRKIFSEEGQIIEHRPYCNGRRKDTARPKLKALPGSRPL